MIRQLNIANYETYVILGNDPVEKLEKRNVNVHISLRFSQNNIACRTDNIENTICYAALVNFLDDKLRNAEFNLIEKMAQFLYDEISAYLNNASILKHVQVTKVAPVKNLGSASFVCADW
ncbi:MAG: dihydroneopterin aldolase [Holosporaceae bacterium]|jgi:dihydroneopterin aldolase|nr:dihydroneopterin aldolase [Holosporaceae bacterium]